MAQEVALIFSLAVDLHSLYELKALNKTKVKSLTDAVQMICEFLQKHYSLLVAQSREHLKRLEGYVRATFDWCKSYVNSSSFSKTFSAVFNNQKCIELRTAMMDCFHIMTVDVNLSLARPVPEVPFGLPVQGDEPPLGIPVAHVASRAPNHPPILMQHEFLDSARDRNWDKVMRMAASSPALVNAHPTGDRPPYTVRWSALHHAAQQGRPKEIKWLLENGASPALQNKEGQRPIDVVGDRGGTKADHDACRALLSTIRAPGVQSSFVPKFSFDLGELGIHPGVDVHLRSCSGAVLSATEDCYELTGPRPAVDRLPGILGHSDIGRHIGFLAPRAHVNLDTASRREAGVPENAVYFRFVYPPSGMTGTLSEAVVDNGLHEPWLNFIILGGFAYYGRDGLLIQLNALTKGDSGRYRLCFGEPRSDVPASLVSQLKRDGMQAISLPALLCEGAAKYSWVNPDPNTYQLGGFVYEANPSLAEHVGSGPPLLGFEVIPSTDPGASVAPSPAAAIAAASGVRPSRTPSEITAAERNIPIEMVREDRLAREAAAIDLH